VSSGFSYYLIIICFVTYKLQLYINIQSTNSSILSLLIGGTFQTYQGVQKLNVLKIEYIEMQIEKTGIDKIKLHWTDLR
jgi:hypothetical protein